MSSQHSRDNLSRRRLLQLGGTVGLGVGLTGRGSPALAREARAARRGKRPKNIVFMVADGMSMGALTLAEPFSRLVRSGGTHWHALLRRADVAHGQYDTASLNSLVTDSSSASSAWGSGSRIVNNVVNMLPDGTRLTPLAPLLKASKRRVGLVTTTTITHATPAGFAAVQVHRDQEAEIAPQYLDLVDVLLGGGSKFFTSDLRKDKRDLIGEFRGRGYAVCATREELQRLSNGSKVLGLFAESHIPFTVDHRNVPGLQRRVPTLAEMTHAALTQLAGASNGFLLQVEGGRVDHAAHSNDPAALLWDMLAFDDAIAVVLEFAQQHPDTLVVITSDHGNGNPGLNGIGEMYEKSDAAFERLAQVTGSYTRISDRLKPLGTDVTAEAIIVAISDVMKIELTSEEAERLRLAAAGKTPDTINRSLASLNGVLGETLSNHFGVAWTGTAHTADLVPISAIGPGQEHFANLRLNTDAFVQMTGLLDIRHRNPAMSPDDAQKFLKKKVLAVGAHWA